MGLIQSLATGAIAIFVGIQFLPIYPRTNPPVDRARTLEAQVDVPVPVANLIDRSCRDCHSNNTRWPLYSRVAPASWVVGWDVAKARKEMNFSEWTEEAGQKLEKAVGLLMASCADVTAGRMPKPQYVLLHSEASLQAQDRNAFCAWSAQQGGKLMALKRTRKAASKPAE